MVRCPLRLLSLFLATLVSVSTLAAKDLAAYNIGDSAEEDIVTPVQLTVVDEAATKILKDREAERIPVHMRYYIHSADQTEAALRTAFTNTRGDFLYVLEASFHKRTLTDQDVATTKFQEIAAAFQKQNILFPVNRELATLWALGQPDQSIIDPAVAKLRAAMEHPVRSTDLVPADTKIGSTARLVMLNDTNEVATEQLAAERGMNYAKTNLISFQRTELELVNSFPPEQHAIAKYVETFITPNCVVDRELTLKLRAKRTDGMLAADHYAAGETIVKRGQVISAKIKAALDQLRENTMLAQVQKPGAVAQAKSIEGLSQMQWILGAFAAAILILAIAVWQLVRRKTPDSLLPARIESGPLDIPGLDGNASEIFWRQRALIAEQRAQQAEAAARSGLLAHLARWMSDKLVRRLISQRTHLLDSQNHAAAEINQLEERVEGIHTRMHDRVLAYKQRIMQLEKQLEAHGETNRELIKAEILTIKKQLELERKKTEGRTELNSASSNGLHEKRQHENAP